MRNLNFGRFLASFVFVSAFFGSSVLGFAAPTIEVVQSVPLETTLAVPGVRLAQEVWLEMIGSAKTSLDIEQFYLSNQAGESLEPVVVAIEKAASRGVRVRLVADKKFYGTYPETIDRISKLVNAEARLVDYAPFGGVQHAKFFVVDGQQGFVGSQNFDWRALNQIHEIGIRVVDEKVSADLQLVFEKDWAMAKGVGAAVTPPAPLSSSGLSISALFSEIVVLASPKQANPDGISDSLTEITNAMNAAQKSIRIQVMEYSTKIFGAGGAWTALDDSIRKAAARGVKVQLLVDVSNIQKAKKDLKALAALSNIEVKSVTIPAWSGGKIDYARLIHSKYLIVDGLVSWVGTENWSMGYFMNTRDVGFMIHTQSVTDQLDQVFERVWTSSYTSGVSKD
ncbi:phospholipase D-like domain-containing protein [Bdellovibrionota bacterium FG-2]